MGDKNINRRAFFQKLANAGDIAEAAPDPLFEKYARKSLGARRYSTADEIPGEATHHSTERVGTVSSGLTAYSGTWTEWEVMHLLRRTGYGVKKADITSLLAMTTGNAVDALLNIATTPSLPSATPLNYYQGTISDSGGVTLGNSWTSTNLTYVASTDSTVDTYRGRSLTSWSWGLCLDGGATIREKMTAFWYHFIPVDMVDIRNMVSNSATLEHQYIKLLRDNCLGNFFTLIQDVAKCPAMLVYLSNQYSTASVPNENFARELMELFTLGKVPTQNYIEDDVKAAAKVLSGWRVSSFTGIFPLAAAFNSTYHNTTNKAFSSFFGSTTITGLTGSSGANEFTTFFNLIFTQQGATIAKYICRRLYRFFVYYDIDANVETNVITPLASALVTNSWNILPVIKLLLKSQHFYDMVNRGVMIKSPVDMIAGALNTLNIGTTAAAGTSQLVNQYAIWQYFNDYCTNYLAGNFAQVPNVSGWKAYYQSPTYYQNWINSTAIQRRSTLLTSFINGLTAGGLLMKLDVMAWVQQFPTTLVQDPDLLVNVIVQYLLPVDLAQTYKDQLKTQNLLGGQITNGYWTTAWTNYAGAPANTTYLNTVKTRLTSLFTAVLQLAEFQLM